MRNIFVNLLLYTLTNVIRSFLLLVLRTWLFRYRNGKIASVLRNKAFGKLLILSLRLRTRLGSVTYKKLRKFVEIAILYLIFHRGIQFSKVTNSYDIDLDF